MENFLTNSPALNKERSIGWQRPRLKQPVLSRYRNKIRCQKAAEAIFHAQPGFAAGNRMGLSNKFHIPGQGQLKDKPVS